MTSRSRIPLRAAAALLATATVLGHPAYGQTAGQAAAAAETTAPAAGALTPPRLITFVDAPYPAAARAAGLQAQVDLEMTIDVTGKVSDVRAVAPVGNGFDEAAVEAARKFGFEPARRGDRAIPARIRYRYVFEIRVAPAPAPQADAPGEAGETGEVKSAVPARVEDQVPKLSAPPAPLEYGATATVEAPPREVTKRSLSGDELLRVAGTRGDPLRAIEYLPGVGRSPQPELIIIRGSSPADSEVQFEGAPVYRLYHFGGLTSFVQPRLLDKIDLYPGNFSARFGRKMGGIIDVGVRDPKTDGLHGMLDVNLIDSSFLLEGPLTQSWSFAVAAKRSYIDLWLGSVVPKEDAQLTAAPVYWDYQAMVAYKPSSADRFRAMIYGSYDDLKLILAHPADGDPALRGGLSSNTTFQRAHVAWQHQYNDAVEHEIDASAGPFRFHFNVGPDLAVQIPGYEGFLRSEWRARITERLRLIGGLDISYNWFDFAFKGPPATQVDGDPSASGTLTGRPSVGLNDSFGVFRPAGYLEAVWQATGRLTLVPGGRVDYLGDVQRWTIDPRLTARYQLTATTTIKGGAGLFSQAPSGSESLPILGNPHLRPSRAQHYSLGVEQELGARWKVTAEGFYKRLDSLIVNSPVPGQNLNNDGIGHIYGGEVSARLRPTTQSSGFLSYTLSRSERNDHGTEWRLFNWDQTHILTVAGAHRLGRGWDLSGTFRYVTGNPLTPVVASVYNANTDTYKPVYGAVNSDRSNAFHRLDLRVEKTWRVRSGCIAAYLDVQNAYNRHNEEGRAYNYNFSQSNVISSLPILPTFGVRGEL